MNLVESCNVCLEDFDNKAKIPQVLKCGHSFCSVCLEKLLKTSNIGNKLCPTCRKKIGYKKAKVIPINYALKNLMLSLLENKICKDHNAPNNWECLNCKLITCGTCVLLNHKICNTNFIEKKLMDKQESFAKFLTVIEKRNKAQLKRLSQTSLHIQAKKKKIESEIQNLLQKSTSLDETIISLNDSIKIAKDEEKQLKNSKDLGLTTSPTCYQNFIKGEIKVDPLADQVNVLAECSTPGGRYLATSTGLIQKIPDILYWTRYALPNVLFIEMEKWINDEKQHICEGSIEKDHCPTYLYAEVTQEKGPKSRISCFRNSKYEHKLLMDGFKEFISEFGVETSMPSTVFFTLWNKKSYLGKLIFNITERNPRAYHFLTLASGLSGRTFQGTQMKITNVTDAEAIVIQGGIVPEGNRENVYYKLNEQELTDDQLKKTELRNGVVYSSHYSEENLFEIVTTRMVSRKVCKIGDSLWVPNPANRNSQEIIRAVSCGAVVKDCGFII